MKKKTAKSSSPLSTLATLSAIGIAAAAGAYFFYGKDAKKRRKKVTSWMLKMQADVLDGIEKMKEVNEGNYNALVEKVSQKYQNLKNVDAQQVSELAKTLGKQWKEIVKEVSPKPKKVSKK